MLNMKPDDMVSVEIDKYRKLGISGWYTEWSLCGIESVPDLLNFQEKMHKYFCKMENVEDIMCKWYCKTLIINKMYLIWTRSMDRIRSYPASYSRGEGWGWVSHAPFLANSDHQVHLVTPTPYRTSHVNKPNVNIHLTVITNTHFDHWLFDGELNDSRGCSKFGLNQNTNSDHTTPLI